MGKEEIKNEFSKGFNILKTSNGKEPEPCSDYDNGYCKSTGDTCDACYGEFLKYFVENEQ